MNKKILTFVCALALSLNISSYAKMSPRSNTLYNQAIMQEQEGNYAQALEHIQAALKYSPDDAVLNIKLAGLYQNLGKHQEAISAYNKAIALRPQDGFLYISLANLFMQKYDYANALSMYEKAQAIMPEYKYNYLNIANCKQLIGNTDGAIAAYK